MLTIDSSTEVLHQLLWQVTETAKGNDPLYLPAIRLDNSSNELSKLLTLVNHGGVNNARIRAFAQEVNDYFQQKGVGAKLEIIEPNENWVKWGNRVSTMVSVRALLWMHGNAYHLLINKEGLFYVC